MAKGTIKRVNKKRMVLVALGVAVGAATLGGCATVRQNAVQKRLNQMKATDGPVL